MPRSEEGEFAQLNAYAMSEKTDFVLVVSKIIRVKTRISSELL